MQSKSIYFSRKPKARFYLLFIVNLLICMHVYADEEETQADMAFLGLGAEQCNVFISTYEHNPASLNEHHEQGDEGPHHKTDYTSRDYIIWLKGYLSAYNFHENSGVNITNNASDGGILNFLYRRCIESPNAPFYSVLPKLLERLESR